MREWLLLGVIALGGILGIWLLFFKSLAALYELWQSGREFDRLKRDAASRRMQRPSELMQKKRVTEVDDNPDMPVIPQALLDSLSDEEADPRLIPQPRAAQAPVEQAAAPAELPGPEAANPVQPVSEAEASEPTTQQPADAPPESKAADESTTTTTPIPPPAFPLPSANDDFDASEDIVLDSPSQPTDQPTEPEPETDETQRPPRYDG